MKNFVDFMSAALPWICMGLLVAVFAARYGRKKSGKEESDSNTESKEKENYGLEGMSFGMCFGVALGTSLGSNTGVGMSLGMLLGLAVGSCIEKKAAKK